MTRLITDKLVSDDRKALLIYRHRGADVNERISLFTTRPSIGYPCCITCNVRNNSFCVIISDKEDYGLSGTTLYYPVLLADICKIVWVKADEIYYA